MDRKHKILIIVFASIFVISGGFLAVHFMSDNKNKYQDYKTDSEVEKTSSTVKNPIDFAKLKEDNGEVVGWIQIPGMEIDYPILQSGADTEEDFYLERDINRELKKSGAIYIQKMNSFNFTDKNTLIYGHNMRNGSMFGTLKNFRNADFFNATDTVYIYIPGHILKYKIYSAFVFDDRHILESFNFDKSEEYREFIDITLNRDTKVKNVRQDVVITPSDRIITLSTCTNNDTERYLVVAVLTDDTFTD